MSSEQRLELDGRALTASVLNQAARGKPTILLSEQGLQEMIRARALVDHAVAERIPIYGVTTGLGARVDETLSDEQLAAYSYQTIRGRAHAVGEPVSRTLARAAMIVRANTFLLGASGASPSIAQLFVDCLNADVTPVVGETGSIGAGDLIWNATLGLALLGEGTMFDGHNNTAPSNQVLAQAGISVPELGPRDGLAICNHAAYSSAYGALSYCAADTAYESAQTAAALSMEGFRATLSPLNAKALRLRPQPGQDRAAEGILERLAGSHLMDPKNARRLQDPLSFRDVPQIHGAVRAALDFAGEAVTVEINGASDNPAALVEDQVIVSTGTYHTPHLTNVLETLSRSFVHLTMAQLARISRMLSPRFTDLPLFLAGGEDISSGFAPLMKTAEAIVARLVHAAQPVAIWPSINADGAEDSLTNAPAAARALREVAIQSSYLTSIELLVAAAAVELRGDVDRLGIYTARVFESIREIASPANEDVPLSNEIETLAEEVRNGRFGGPRSEH